MGSTEVNFNGYGNYPYTQYQQAGAYVTGKTVENATDSVFSGLGAAVLLDGTIGFVGAARKAKKNEQTVKSLFTDFAQAFKAQKPVITGEILKNKSTYTNLFSTAGTKGSIKMIEKCIPSAEKMAKLSKSSNISYELALKWAEKAKMTQSPEIAKTCIKNAEKALAKATLNATKNPITKKLATFATKSPITAKAGKLFKASGAGFVAAIEGCIELVTQVVPTFIQLGPTKGVKQLGKSALKVAGSAGGWMAGAAVGAAIGSVIPGAGTVVGGIIGAVISTACSMLGSSLGSKLATSITGKSELEIAAEKEAQQEVPQQEVPQQFFAQPQTAIASNNIANQVSFSSNPFSSSDWMNKDIMALSRGYAC